MFDIVEIKMSSGILVRARPVPPYVTGEVYDALPPPPSPMVELQSAAGGTEIKRALPDTPEWEDYQKAVRKHRDECHCALLDFELDYGVVEWLYPDPGPERVPLYEEGENVWWCGPPEDWEPPPIMKRWNVEYSSLRVAFIKHELVVTDGDQKALTKVQTGMKSVTAKEARTGLVPSPSLEVESA